MQELAPSDELALGPGDSFEVRVFGEADLSGSYRLAADGTIDYPLVGQLQLSGMTPHVAAGTISKALAEKFLRHPQVSILVRDQSSKKILVIGQVSKPGTYSFVPNMSILEVITLAGGFTAIASKNHVMITRIEDKQKSSIEVPVFDIGEGRAKNVSLRPGDIVSVPERIL